MAPDGRGLGGTTVAPWARACEHETSRRGGGVRERRVGEGEREEMRGDFRRGGRHSACAGTLNKTGHTHPNPRVHLLACVRECGARASQIEGWARR